VTIFNSSKLQLFTIVTFFATLWILLWWQLSGEWSVNDQYSYGWSVPFFAVVLFWLRFEDAPQAQEVTEQRSAVSSQRTNNREPITNNSKARAIAILIAVVALLLLFPIRLFEIGNPDWRPLSWLHAICAVTITLVFLWSRGGRPWLRHFAFPVLFTLIAVPWISPIETPIIQGLMRIIAAVAAETANLLGIPAQVQGNLIQVRTGLIGVNEACSGVRSLQTSLMIGLLFGELKRLSIFRRVALIAGALAIALIANFARAVFLVWLGADEGISAINRWHDFAGYGIVVLVFAGSMLLARLLAKSSYRLSVKGYQDTNNKERITNNSAATDYVIPWTALVVAVVWLVSVEFAAAGWYRAHEQNVIPAPHWTVHWPNDAAGFHEFKIDEGVRSTLRYDEAKQAAWNLAVSKPAGTSDFQEQSAMARCISFFFRWKPGGSSVVRARAHRPDICLPAAGWRQISDRGVANYRVNQNLELPFHHLAFADERGGVTAHTFFCLQEDKLQPNEPRPDLQVSGGAQPDWSFRSRSGVVLNGVRNRGQQIIEIVLISSHRLNDEDAETEFGKMVPSIIEVESKK
jgi:exosortase